MPKLKNSAHGSFNKPQGLSTQQNPIGFIDLHGKPNHHGGKVTDVSFTFSTDLTSVTGMSALNVKNLTSSNSVDITNSTFKTTVGLNDKNVQAVLSVQQKTSDTNIASTHIYSDKDGDGQYTQTFDIAVAKLTSATHEQQKFTVNTDGTITATAVVPSTLTSATTLIGPDRGHCPNDVNAVLEKVTLNNVAYVTKTAANPQATGYHFEIFRDDNNDGTWTEIAHGETSGANINATTKTIDLVGIQSYLTDASAVVG
jgi:hypothetical protein